MNFLATLNQVVVLFILMLIGFGVKRLKLIEDSFNRNLSNLLFYIIMPAMIINAMDYSFSPQLLIKGFWLIMAGFFVMALSGVVGIIYTKSIKEDKLSKNVYQFGIMISNFGYMGFPVCELLYGKEGLFYAALFNIPIFIIVNSIGVLIIARGSKRSAGIDLKNIFNPPVISVFVGLLFFIFSVKLPSPITNSVKMVAATTTPLSMMLAGISLANARVADLFFNYKVYVVTFIRLIVLPMLVLIILKAVGATGYMLSIPVIITAMPIAANVSLLAEKYESNAYLAAQTVFISTLISILTIPVIAWIVR